MTCQPSS